MNTREKRTFWAPIVHLAVLDVERQKPVEDVLGGDVVAVVQVVDVEQVDDRRQLELDRDRLVVLLENSHGALEHIFLHPHSLDNKPASPQVAQLRLL